MQDYPNYKYRPRRKKRDGQKQGSGGGNSGANNNNKASNNNNVSGTGGGASPKHDLEDTKFESSKGSDAGYGQQHAGSSDTPPLYDTSETHAAATNLSRSFTIPTPESSPSSCTSDAYHSGYQPLPPAPPVNIEGETGENSFNKAKQTNVLGLRSSAYALPTPEVSPLDPTPRSLSDYHHYVNPPPPLLSPQDRFSFEAAGSLAGEMSDISQKIAQCQCFVCTLTITDQDSPRAKPWFSTFQHFKKMPQF